MNNADTLHHRPFVHHKSASFTSYLTGPLTPSGRIDFDSTSESTQNDPGSAASVSPSIVFTKKLWVGSKPLPTCKLGFNKSGRTQESCIESTRAAGILKRLPNLYQYTRIAPDQVRLLYIKPGRFEESINASLLVVNDYQLGTDEVPYVALSYHWGCDDISSTIIIQDDPQSRPVKNLEEITDMADAVCAISAKTLKIKPNLNQALKHLRDEECSITVWVDALCINQFDTVEKEHQLLKMAKIYRKAWNVNIWLGCDDPEHPIADRAMALITDINQGNMLIMDDAHIKSWAALFELLRWSWFSRRWIVQELVLAKCATVHCGKHLCPWSDFQNAVSIFCLHFEKLKPKLIAHFESSSPGYCALNDDSMFEIEQLGANILVDMTSTCFRTREDGTIESTKGLEYLVCRLSGFDTSDPRDTIYALRNIAKELNRPDSQTARRFPAPDYEKDLFEVYRDFVKYAIEDSKSIDILCRHWALKELPKKTPTTPRLVNLPSWIKFADDSPFGKGEDLFNGRKAGDSFVGLPGSNIYHASGIGASRKPPVISFPESRVSNPFLHNVIHDTSVTVRGLPIGTISLRTTPFPDGIIPAECLSLLGYSPTRNPPPRLWQTLVASRAPDGKPACPWYATACAHALQHVSRNSHLNIKSTLRALRLRQSSQESIADAMLTQYLQRVLGATWDRVFVEANPLLNPTHIHHPSSAAPDSKRSEKFVGLAPPKTAVDDLIAVLYGCSVPVILRLVTRSGVRVGYEFIGEAYVYGMMEGEALEGEFEEMDFNII